MFEFDATKLIIIAIVALIVIGPKDLPRVLRQVGQIVAKLRHMAADFQAQFMDAMREADLADLKAEATKLAESAKIDAAFNPVAELKKELTEAVEATEKARPEAAPAMPGQAAVMQSPALEPGHAEPSHAASEPDMGPNPEDQIPLAEPAVRGALQEASPSVPDKA